MVRMLIGAIAVLWSYAATAQPAEPLADAVARDFVRTQRLVDVGGRKLNLHCMGDGPRTVFFDAGGSDWSVIWALVQPAVAGHARACSYDRAGLGYSDPAPLPRTPVAIVEDMHALIDAAGLRRPLVLVGHSLGGFNVKLYAALYPGDVAGLVLVDPAEERADARVRPMLDARFGTQLASRAELLDQTFLALLLERYRNCADQVRAGPLDPASTVYRRCSDPVRPLLGPLIAAERLRIQVTPAYQQAQASEILNSVYADPRGTDVYARLFRPGRFGSKPLIVLSHGLYDREDAIAAAGQAAGVALHRGTAQLSRRGVQRTVPGTTHNIEIDAPGAIVDAVVEVLRQLDAKRGR